MNQNVKGYTGGNSKRLFFITLAVTHIALLCVLAWTLIRGFRLHALSAIALTAAGVMICIHDIWFARWLRRGADWLSPAPPNFPLGFYGHETFLRLAYQELSRAARDYTPLSMLRVHVEATGFNASPLSGRSLAGPELEMLLRTLSQNTREGDFLTMVENKEFLVLLPSAGRQEARLAADRIAELLKISFDGLGAEENGRFSVKVGLVTYPDDGENIRDLVELSRFRLAEYGRTAGGMYPSVC